MNKRYKFLCYFIFVLFSFQQVSAQFSIQSITTTPVTCNGDTDGKVAITVSGGKSPYDYRLFNSSFNQVGTIDDQPSTYEFTLLPPEGYYVIVLDDDGTAINSFGTGPDNVGEPDLITVSFNPASPADACDDVPITLNATPAGGSEDYSAPGGYNWTGADVSPLSATNIEDPEFRSANVGGSYTFTLTVTDNLGCTGNGNITVDVNALPTPIVAGNNSVCDGANGETYSTANNAGSSYNWVVTGGSIASGQGTNQITVNWGATGAGNVEVTETTAAGCIASDDLDVTINALPNPSVAGDNSVCANASGELYSTALNAGSTYVWTVTGGSIAAGQGTSQISVDWGAAGAGTVEVTETDANGCVNNDVLNVTINGLPTPSINGDNSVCTLTAGEIYSTTDNAGSSYLWVVAGGSITGGQGTNSITVDWGAAGAGTVTVTETDANGCEDSDVLNVTINALPTPSVVGDNSVCTLASGEAYSTVNNAGSSYLWVVVGGSITGGQGSNAITVDWGAAGAGTVTVTETDVNGCENSDVLNVTINDLPTPGVNGSNSVCDGSVGEAYSTTDNAGSTYLWVVTGGSIAGGQGSASITVDWGAAGPGTVEVTETDANGCVNNDILNVTINALPTPSVNGDNSVCAGSTGEIYSTANNAGSTYLWTVTGGSITGGQGSNSITVDWGAAGAGSVEVAETDVNGCTDNDVLNVTINALPTPSVIGDNAICENASGEVYSTANNAGNTYLWAVSGGTITGGQGTNSITVDWGAAGNGTVSVTETDPLSCEGTDVLNVTIYDLPTPALNGDNRVCQFDAGVVYTTDAGMTAYNWQITGGTITSGGGANDNTATVTWNTVGNQSISVSYTDGNGCSAASPTVLVVQVLSLPNPSLSGNDEVCEGDAGVIYSTEPGNIDYDWQITGGTITSGGGAFDFTATVTWDTPGNQSISVNYDGGNGCLALAPTVLPVTVNPAPTPSLNGNNDVCLGASGEVYTTDAGQSNYVWSIAGGTITSGGGATDNTATVTWTAEGAQSISVNYDDAEGCSALSPTVFAVTVSGLPTPSLNGTNDLCVGTAGEVYTTDAGQNNYNWQVTGGTITLGGGPNDNTATVTWTDAGNQTISVNYEDANGCTAASPAVLNVTVNALPIPALDGDDEVCDEVTGVIYSTDAGQSNYNWQITGGTITSGGGANDNTATVTWTDTGNQSISVNYTDANGCTALAPTTLSVTVNDLPSPSLAGSNLVCQNESNVIYTTDAGQSNYAWQIVGGTITSGGGTNDNTATVTWINPGGQSISVNYVDANGCTALSPTTLNVNVKSAPIPALNGDNEACEGDAGLLYTSNPGMTNYDWQISGGTITLGGGTDDNFATVTWTTAGNQSISVNYTGGNGCRAINPTELSVTVHELPTVTISGDNSACIGGATSYSTEAGQSNYDWTVSGVDGVDYSITNGGGATDNTIDITWLTSGNKTVSVNYENANGCSAASPTSQNVTVFDLPVVTITANATTCIGVNETYTTEAGQNNYNWTVSGVSGVDFTIVSGGTTDDNGVEIIWLTDGAKTVSVNYTDANGCTALAPTDQNVTVNPLPVITITANATACIGVAETYTTEAGQSNYTWTISGTDGVDYNIVSGGTNTDDDIVIEWLTDGNKTVSVNYTDGNGCSAVSPTVHNVTVNPLPVVSIIADAQACIGVNETYSTQSGNTGYNWTVSGAAGVDFNIISGGTVNDDDVVIQWLTTGAKTLSVNYTDPNGCTATAPATHNLTVNDLPVVTITANATTCIGVNETYATEAGQTDYTWTISGAEGVDYTIISGGTTNDDEIVILWLTDGAKTVSVNYTDPNGCTATAATDHNVTVNPLPVVTITANATACIGVAETYSTEAGQSDYTWTIPGTDGVDYNILSGGTLTDDDVVIEWLTDGNKTVSVNYTDGSGCSAVTPTTHNVTVNPLPVVSIIAEALACIGVNETYSTQAGNTGYNWTISGVAGVDFNIISGGTVNDDDVVIQWLTTGAKTVSVNYTDPNGCTATAPATHNLTVNDLPVVTITANATTCVGVEETYTTEAGQSNYNWTISGVAGVDFAVVSGGSTNDNEVVISWLTDGAKTVSVNYTDPNGCSAVAPTEHNVTVNPLPVVTITANATACIGVAETYTTEAGQSDYSWNISGTDGVDYTIVSGGTNSDNDVVIEWLTTGAKTISVNYTDGNSCSAATPTVHNVTVNPLPVVTISGDTAVCINEYETFTTEAGNTNYIWTVSGVEGVDFDKTEGTVNDNAISIRWYNTGTESVSVNYTNANGCTAVSATSQAINVRPATAVALQPVAELGCEGDTARFITSAAGTGPFSYIWQVFFDGGSTWQTISGLGNPDFIGASDSAMMIINLDPSYEGRYRCIITGACGLPIPTNEALLSVNPAPDVSFAGLAAEYCEGDAPVALTGNQAPNGTFDGTGITDNLDGTAQFDPATTGNYDISYSYTDGNSCTSTDVQSVTVHPLPADDLAVAGDAICAGDTAIITVSASENGVGYQLRLDSDDTPVGNPVNGTGGDIEFKVTPSSPADYNILATNATTGCSAELINKASVLVSPGMNTTITTDSPGCPGDSDGRAVVTPSGGTPEYAFQWFSDAEFTTPILGASDSIIDNRPAGKYYVQVFDFAGCFVNDSAEITDPDSIAVNNITSVQPTCPGDGDGEISITANGGTGDLNYSFDAGAFDTDTVFSGLSANAYDLQIRDDNGCILDTTISLTDPLALSIDNILVRNISCGGESDGIITVQVSEGSPPYAYVLNEGGTPTGNTTGANNGIFTGVPVGTDYTVEITDNCETVETGIIEVTTPLPINIDTAYAVDRLCNGIANDSLIVYVSGGNEPYVFRIGTDSIISNSPGIFVGLGPGNYEVVVTDTGYCTYDTTEVLTIDEPVPIILTRDSVFNLSCGGYGDGAIYISGENGIGELEYHLFGIIPKDTVFLSEEDGVFTGLEAREYEVAISDSNGCVVRDTITLTEPPPILVSILDTATVSCFGSGDGMIRAVATGGRGELSYYLLPGNIASLDNDTGYFENLAGNNYTVMAVDTAGCMGSSRLIALPEPPEITATYSDVMENDTISLTIFGAGGRGELSYSIYNNDTIYQPQDTGYFENLAEDLYYVSILDTAGCQLFDSVYVDGRPPFNVSVLLDSIKCAGDLGTIVLIPDEKLPEDTIYYDIGVDSAFSAAAFYAFDSLPPGTYSIYAEHQDGRVFRDEVTFTPGSEILLDTIYVTDVETCAGDSSGAIEIIATGGTGDLLYSINNGITYTDTSFFDSLPARPTPYLIRVQDANKCVLQAGGVVISEPEPLSITISKRNPVGDDLGWIDIQVTGGTGDIAYLLAYADTSIAQDTGYFANLDSALYVLTVSDINGCSLDTSIRLNYLPAMDVLLTYQDSVNCYGGSGAYILLTALTDTTVDYSIDGGSTLQSSGNYDNLPAGEYPIYVEDAYGRIFTDTLEISQPPQIVILDNTTNVSCDHPDFTDGAIDITVTGGVGGYSYLWSNDAETEDIDNLSVGEYAVVVTDNNSCTMTDTFTLEADETVVANAGPDKTVCPDDNQTTLEGSGTGGNIFFWTPNYRLSNSGISNPVVTVERDTSYILTVTSDGGCYGSDTVRVGLFPLVGLNAGPEDTMKISVNNSVELTAAEGFTNYQWTPNTYMEGDTTINPTVTPEVDIKYYVSAFNEHGCLETDSVQVLVAQLIEPYTGFSPNGDGRNDYWEIKEAAFYDDIEVMVFNRWGQQVFYSQGYTDDQRWNGKRDNAGKDLPVGTYYYVIKFGNGITLKGPITIVR